jgi:hypothetical protein
MFGVLVLNGVDGVVDGTDVVAVDQTGPQLRVVQLHKQLMKLAHLCHAICHSTVLCSAFEWETMF